jgi:hypothetical protein
MGTAEASQTKPCVSSFILRRPTCMLRYHSPPSSVRKIMKPADFAVIRQRISDVEKQLQATMGHLKAMEAGLRLSIATHTDLNGFLAALDVFEEGLLAPGDGSPRESDPGYDQALHDGLSAIRHQLTQIQANRS